MGIFWLEELRINIQLRLEATVQFEDIKVSLDILGAPVGPASCRFRAMDRQDAGPTITFERSL